MVRVIADNIFGNEVCDVKNIVDYCEKEQVDQMLSYAHACDTRDYLMLRILWRAGLRVSELLNIRPQDLEPQNQILNVVKAKGGKQRRVMLDPETIDFLLQYIFDEQIPRKDLYSA
jgi:integrase/recombinase XerD